MAKIYNWQDIDIRHERMCVYKREMYMSKLWAFIYSLISLGPADGYKTILAAILTYLPTVIPGFPVLDLGHGITVAQILLALAALKKALQLFKVVPVVPVP